LLGDGEGIHVHSHDPSRRRPGFGIDVGSDRSGQQEPSWPPIRVNSSLYRTEDGGNDLPLVEQDGRVEFPQSRIGVGFEGSCLRWTIELHDRRSMPRRGGRLAGRSRSDYEHGRKFT
jgi:hypothetical protein